LQIDLGQFSGLAQALAYIENKPLPLPDELLQTGGVYAFVRHPLYLFSLMIIWALPVMTEGLLIFNLGTTLYFIFGSLLEEKRMLRIFGDEYRAYQQRVPWLVPLLRRR
jgi:protein-S-isoprenylcysteine O-methyltransferase Ste14